MCKIICTIYLCGHRRCKIEDCAEWLAAGGAYPCGGPYFWNRRERRQCSKCTKHGESVAAQEEAALGYQQRPSSRDESSDLDKSKASSKSGASSKHRVEELKATGQDLPL